MIRPVGTLATDENRINLQFTFTEIFLTIPSHEAYFGPQIIGQEL